MKSRVRFFCEKRQGESPREMEIEEGRVFAASKEKKDDEIKPVNNPMRK